MGKRYYCDFCDKTFPNNSANRKKHNQGTSHQAIRNAFYSNYKDLATIIAEEREKKLCHKYITTGYCAFGIQCRCSHKTPQELQYLEELYKYEYHKKAVKQELESNIKKKEKNKQFLLENKQNKNNKVNKLISEHLNREENELLEKRMPKFEIPDKISDIRLPISLLPPQYKDFIDYDLNKWS